MFDRLRINHTLLDLQRWFRRKYLEMFKTLGWEGSKSRANGRLATHEAKCDWGNIKDLPSGSVMLTENVEQRENGVVRSLWGELISCILYLLRIAGIKRRMGTGPGPTSMILLNYYFSFVLKLSWDFDFFHTKSESQTPYPDVDLTVVCKPLASPPGTATVSRIKHLGFWLKTCPAPILLPAIKSITKPVSTRAWMRKDIKRTLG